VNFVATKQGMTTIFFHPSLLLLFLDSVSEIRDPGWLKIRIRDKHPGSATLVFNFNNKGSQEQRKTYYSGLSISGMALSNWMA
jgi:hypothetical protein